MIHLPLLLAAIAYATGVVAANYLALPLGLCLAMAFVLTGAGGIIAAKRELFIGLSILALGFCNQRLQTTLLAPHDLRVLAGTKPVYGTLTGTLVETPYQKFYEHRQEVSWRTLAVMDVARFEEDGKPSRASLGRVAISTPGVVGTNYYGGEQFSVPGVLSVPTGPLAEDLFDYKGYLERNGIYYQLQVKSPADWKRGSTNTIPPYADRFLSWAQRTLARGLPEEDEALQLLWAMTLGWKTALSGEVPEPFMRSGTIDQLAFVAGSIPLV
jgi:hypothetical protein